MGVRICSTQSTKNVMDFKPDALLVSRSVVERASFGTTAAWASQLKDSNPARVKRMMNGGGAPAAVGFWNDHLDQQEGRQVIYALMFWTRSQLTNPVGSIISIRSV